MTAISLGSTPLQLMVSLYPTADFISGIDSIDGPWPTTAVLALVFNDTAATTWTATLNGVAADWNIDKAAVAALIGRLPNGPRVRLTYTDGTTDLLWAQGRVMVGA